MFSQIKVFCKIPWNSFIPPFIFWGKMLHEFTTTTEHSMRSEMLYCNGTVSQRSQCHIRNIVKDVFLIHQNLLLTWRVPLGSVPLLLALLSLSLHTNSCHPYFFFTCLPIHVFCPPWPSSLSLSLPAVSLTSIIKPYSFPPSIPTRCILTAK